MALCERHGVKLVGSGHLHKFRRVKMGETKLIWAPATSFLMDKGRVLPGASRLGYMRYRFGRTGFTARMIDPPLFLNLSVPNWNRHKGSTIHLPPRLPRPQSGVAVPAEDLIGSG